MRLRLLAGLLLLTIFLAKSEAKARGPAHEQNGRTKLHNRRRTNLGETHDLHSKGQKVHTRKIEWLNVHEVSGCSCKEGEICIEGPHKANPICVNEHHLRESARLFRQYHERKEEAEEELNEVDPQADPPHDVHIKVITKHKEDSSNTHPKRGHHGLVLNKSAHLLKGERNVGRVHKSGQHRTVTCDESALDQMRQRLTGWFHLLHGKDHHHHRHPRSHRHKKHHHISVKKELHYKSEDGKCDCLKSVMWEFRQLDADGDHSVNRTELTVIENNELEPCLHPYLWSCDKDFDGQLSRLEWCCCFPEVDSEAPCYARLREIESSKGSEKYIPRCDKEGYYEIEQCMTVGDDDDQMCWCATPNGSKIRGTQTSGRAHCGKLDEVGYDKKNIS